MKGQEEVKDLVLIIQKLIIFSFLQVLLILHEVFPAVQFAEKATRLQPNWWSAFQTLGRALLGLGEVHLVSINNSFNSLRHHGF